MTQKLIPYLEGTRKISCDFEMIGRNNNNNDASPLWVSIYKLFTEKNILGCNPFVVTYVPYRAAVLRDFNDQQFLCGKVSTKYR